jgi:hypothetical protein
VGTKKEVLGEGFVIIDVDNPLYSSDHAESASNPRRTKAVYNYRESPASLMYARGKIDAAQYRAADWYRRMYETAGSSVKAMDWRREPVDGGKMQDPFTQRRSDAHQAIEETYELLGARGHELIEKFCAQGFFIKQISLQEVGAVSKRHEAKISAMIKECLSVIAVERGFETDKKRKR